MAKNLKKGDYFTFADGFGVVIDDDNKGTAVLVKGRIGYSIEKGNIPEDAVKINPGSLTPAIGMALIGALAAVSDSNR